MHRNKTQRPEDTESFAYFYWLFFKKVGLPFNQAAPYLHIPTKLIGQTISGLEPMTIARFQKERVFMRRHFTAAWHEVGPKMCVALGVTLEGQPLPGTVLPEPVVEGKPKPVAKPVVEVKKYTGGRRTRVPTNPNTLGYVFYHAVFDPEKRGPEMAAPFEMSNTALSALFRDRWIPSPDHFKRKGWIATLRRMAGPEKEPYVCRLEDYVAGRWIPEKPCVEQEPEPINDDAQSIEETSASVSAIQNLNVAFQPVPVSLRRRMPNKTSIPPADADAVEEPGLLQLQRLYPDLWRSAPDLVRQMYELTREKTAAEESFGVAADEVTWRVAVADFVREVRTENRVILIADEELSQLGDPLTHGWEWGGPQTLGGESGIAVSTWKKIERAAPDVPLDTCLQAVKTICQRCGITADMPNDPRQCEATKLIATYQQNWGSSAAPK